MQEREKKEKLTFCAFFLTLCYFENKQYFKGTLSFQRDIAMLNPKERSRNKTHFWHSGHLGELHSKIIHL